MSDRMKYRAAIWSQFIGHAYLLYFILPDMVHAKKRGVVIGVSKFSQEFLIIGIFWKFLYKYFIKIPVEAT